MEGEEEGREEDSWFWLEKCVMVQRVFTGTFEKWGVIMGFLGTYVHFHVRFFCFCHFHAILLSFTCLFGISQRKRGGVWGS